MATESPGQSTAKQQWVTPGPQGPAWGEDFGFPVEVPWQSSPCPLLRTGTGTLYPRPRGQLLCLLGSKPWKAPRFLRAALPGAHTVQERRPLCSAPGGNTLQASECNTFTL